MDILTAVLDANVLFPATLRDTLVRAGQRGIYRMQWTTEILEEVRRNLVKTGRGTETQAQRLVDTLMMIFPLALMRDEYQSLIPIMQNHVKDRHVLAAAVACKAQVIVTSNLHDFPRRALEPYSIEAQAPDRFLVNLCQENVAELAQIINEQVADLRNPPQTVEQELAHMGKIVPNFVQTIRDYLANSESALNDCDTI